VAGVLPEVSTVRVEVTETLVLITRGFTLNEQIGAAAPPGTLLQERNTLPVKPFAGPFEGVTVMVEVAVPPAVMEAGFNAVAVSA
jgi:hypothetical protein